MCRGGSKRAAITDRPMRPDGRTGVGALVKTKTRQPVQVPDLRAAPAYADRNPLVVTGVELGGIRTLLSVPTSGAED
jgi:hypothetical protein